MNEHTATYTKNVGSAQKDEDGLQPSADNQVHNWVEPKWYNIPKMFNENRYMHSKIEKGDTDTDACACTHIHKHTHTHAHSQKCRLWMLPYSMIFNYGP